MPKIKFGATREEVQNAQGGTREAPTPGMYRAKVLSIDWEDKIPNKDPRFHVVFELVSGEAKGYRIHTYLIPESDNAKWKWHSFLIAVGLMNDKKLKGELNTDRPQDLPHVMLRTKNETYEGTERAKENGIFPLKDDDPDAEELEAEVEDDETGDEDEVDLDAMDRNELKALIKEQGLSIRVLKSMDDDAVRAAIVEAMGGDGEDEEEEEEDEDEDEASGEDAEDYNTWGIPDLKGELESRGLKTTGPKPQLVKRLEESDEADPFAEE